MIYFIAQMPVEQPKRSVTGSRPDVGDHSPAALKRGPRPFGPTFQEILNRLVLRLLLLQHHLPRRISPAVQSTVGC